MNAEEAITDLLIAYADAVDAGDFDRLGALFDHGVLRSPRGEARGAAAVTDWYRAVRLYDDGTPQTTHHVFGVAIDVDGDTATARSYITVVQHGRPIITASYDDTFVKACGEWRFATRDVTLDLLGDLTGHLTP